MDFGEALKALKAGKRVARDGWNGKGMWLVLVRVLVRGEMITSFRYDVSWPFNGPDLTFHPWIGMKTADNAFVPWVVSQADMLAEDWVAV